MSAAALHHDLVAAAGAKPAAWLLVLHGMLGQGGNFRTFARRLVDRRRDVGVALVDLRLHGRSRQASPPHTVAAAADDVLALAGKLDGQGHAPIGVLGHSLGGKVALAVRATRPPWLRTTWVVDASPGPRPDLFAATDLDSVARVLDLVAACPTRYARRDDFVATLAARGLDRITGQWLAQNLDPDAERGGFALNLDLGAMRALLADYAAVDLWPALERPDPGAVHVIIGGRSRAVSADDRARLAATARAHVLPEAGHWVHVDALDALVSLVAQALPGPG